MITTKTCSTCEHFPNDHHCVGCLWDENKRGNTKWELKKNPIVIEREVLDKIREEIEKVFCISVVTNELRTPMEVKTEILQIIDKYRAEGR